MPSRNARRSSTHHSSIAPEDVGSRSSIAPGFPDDAKYTLASSLLATMMREVIIDHALMAHKNITRLKRSQGRLQGGCSVCKTTCQSSTLENNQGTTKGESSVKEEDENSTTTTNNESTNTIQPKGLEIYHNNPLLSCIICSRQVSANRYAQHLASCVGVGKGGIARRKGKSNGNSKVKTALENRKRAGLLMSGASTPIQQRSNSINDDGTGIASDDEFIKRSKSNLSNSFTKRSASPAIMDNSAESKKLRTEDGPSRAHSLLGASALTASQPATGSPLNPLRHSKTITIDSDEDEEDDEDEEEEEEGAISMSQGQKSTNAPQSSSVLSGEEGSDFAGDDSGSDDDNESEDGSYQERPKGHHRSETASLQSEPEDDF